MCDCMCFSMCAILKTIFFRKQAADFFHPGLGHFFTTRDANNVDSGSITKAGSFHLHLSQQRSMKSLLAVYTRLFFENTLQLFQVIRPYSRIILSKLSLSLKHEKGRAAKSAERSFKISCFPLACEKRKKLIKFSEAAFT